MQCNREFEFTTQDIKDYKSNPISEHIREFIKGQIELRSLLLRTCTLDEIEATRGQLDGLEIVQSFLSVVQNIMEEEGVRYE